jgi:DnaK suppressor protein
MPKASPTHVSRDQELRRILERERQRILDAVQLTIRKERTTGDADDGEVQDEAERSEADVQTDLEFAFLQMQGETLRHIEEALERHDAGEYGVCAECGSDIAVARLYALPWAVRCTSCEQDRESRTRRHRPTRTAALTPAGDLWGRL